MDITTIDLNTLVDIRSVKVDKNLPIEKRIADFVKQIKNPYFYKCGKVAVQISFSNTKETLEDRLEGYLSAL